MGRLQEALPEYRRAVALAPSSTGGAQRHEFGEVTAGRYDEALTHAKRALALQPNTPVAYYHAGVPLMLLDDDGRSERFLSAAEARFASTTQVDRRCAWKSCWDSWICAAAPPPPPLRACMPPPQKCPTTWRCSSRAPRWPCLPVHLTRRP